MLIVFISEKGLFSVIVEDDLIFTCETGHNFDNSAVFDVFLSYSDILTPKKFLYDCPLMKH